MAQEHTERGFAVYARVQIGGDGYDLIVDFTVQESSLATERRVWVGKGEHRGHLTEQQARAVRDALTEFLGDEGDEYHTMDELYEYRMLYNAHAAQGWLAATFPVVKSWWHSDGELCFGGGWFIVVAELPTGQVANHYKAEHWDLFDVPAVDLPPRYDGHTPDVAAERLRAAVTP